MELRKNNISHQTSEIAQGKERVHTLYIQVKSLFDRYRPQAKLQTQRVEEQQRAKELAAQKKLGEEQQRRELEVQETERQAKENQTRQLAHEKYRAVLAKFELHVTDLETKAASHRFVYGELAETARKLVSKLKKLGDAYYGKTRSAEERKEFLSACEQTIEDHRDVFEEHHELSILLQNLCLSLVNAIIELVYQSNFFPLKRTEIGIHADALELSLKTEVNGEESPTMFPG